MKDDLKKLLYGNTKQITLADGKEYTFRELSLSSIPDKNMTINQVFASNDMRLIAYVMLKEDHPDIDMETVGRLITASMLGEDQPFIQGITELMGTLGASKNAPAGNK